MKLLNIAPIVITPDIKAELDKSPELSAILHRLQEITSGAETTILELAGLCDRITHLSGNHHVNNQLISQHITNILLTRYKEEQKKNKEEQKKSRHHVDITLDATIVNQKLPEEQLQATIFDPTISRLFSMINISTPEDVLQTLTALSRPTKMIDDFCTSHTRPFLKRDILQLACLSKAYGSDTNPTSFIEVVTDHKTCGDALNIITQAVYTPHPLNQPKNFASIPQQTLCKLAGQGDFASRQIAIQHNEDRANKSKKIADDLRSTISIYKDVLPTAKKEMLLSLAEEASHHETSFKTAANKVMVLQEITNAFMPGGALKLNKISPKKEPTSEEKKLKYRLDVVSEKLWDATALDPSIQSGELFDALVMIDERFSKKTRSPDHYPSIHKSLNQLEAWLEGDRSKNISEILQEIHGDFSKAPETKLTNTQTDLPKPGPFLHSV